MASMAGVSMTAAPGGGPLLPGSRVGKYEIERHLGRGGMGDVYLVKDTVINRKAALKTIREDNNLDSRQVIELRQRFYREGQTAGALSHPNIVTVYDLGEALGMSYIVMEFVEGQTLAQLMKKSRLSVAQIKHVVYHAAMGLDYAHKNGIFHRDVKPDNIMVSKTGTVKVMDFGIARLVESQLTQTGSVMGTPAYMSPEQVNGHRIDQRSDVFSLGVILYELLTGKKPFTGDTVSSLMFAIVKADPAQPSALDAKIGTSWDQILAKALAKGPDQRFASARDLARRRPRREVSAADGGAAGRATTPLTDGIGRDARGASLPAPAQRSVADRVVPAADQARGARVVARVEPAVAEGALGVVLGGTTVQVQLADRARVLAWHTPGPCRRRRWKADSVRRSCRLVEGAALEVRDGAVVAVPERQLAALEAERLDALALLVRVEVAAVVHAGGLRRVRGRGVKPMPSIVLAALRSPFLTTDGASAPSRAGPSTVHPERLRVGAVESAAAARGSWAPPSWRRRRCGSRSTSLGRPGTSRRPSRSDRQVHSEVIRRPRRRSACT